MNARWPAWRLDGPDQELRYDEGFPGERLPNQVRIRIAA
jgi:hypothetical protein